MANAEQAPAPAPAPPVRSEDQILPCSQWVLIGKSNCYLNEEKSQPIPIYKIAMDILKQTNFFRAFTASLAIPAIYIQQFWDTICFDSKAGCYKCQLDEHWFDLTKDTLRDALLITPVDNNRAFSTPPSIDNLIKFVNKLGYPREVLQLSNVTTNDMFQPWRALTTIINLCLTRKTSGFERPRAPRVHKFHPRPRSTLHLPSKEPALGNLKFAAKGTKREVFGMLIPKDLLNDVILGSDYYNAYQNKVTKHQRYLAGKDISDPDSPAPKSVKPTKSTKLIKPTAAQQDKPTESKAATKKSKPAPAKPQEKKRKPKTEATDVLHSAKRSKAGKVLKKRSGTTAKKLVDEFMDEEVPTEEPRLEVTEEEILQREGYIHLPETKGKGKEKVGEEQATQVLLNLQTAKKKSPIDQYIFQRCSQEPTKSSGHEESLSLYAELGFSSSDSDLDETTSSVIRSKTQDEDQARSDLDSSSQPQPEHIDEGFTATAYPNIQENLKMTVDEPVIPEEPFFNNKPTEADNEKMTAETEAESMVSVTIHQDTSPLSTTTPAIEATITTVTTTLPLPPQPQPTSSESHIIKCIGELEQLFAGAVEGNKEMVKYIESQEIDRKIRESVEETVSATVRQAMRAPLLARFKDLPTSDMKDIRMQRMLDENYEEGNVVNIRLGGDHRTAVDALQKSILRDVKEYFDAEKAEKQAKKKRKQDSPKTPPRSPPSSPPPPPPPLGASGAFGSTGASESAQEPPPPPPTSSTHQGGQSTSTAAPSSSKTAITAEYTTWTIIDAVTKPTVASIPEELLMDENAAMDEQAYSSNDEEMSEDHIPIVNLNQSWWKPITEERPATLEPKWTIPSSHEEAPKNNWAAALKSAYVPPPENSLLAYTGPAYEIVKIFHPDVVHLQFQMEECHKLLTDKVDDAILKYNVNKPLPLGDRKAVRTHMRIISVVRIEVFSLYGYNYMKKIILRRADFQEHVIAERDFKYLYLSDFKDFVPTESPRSIKPSLARRQKDPYYGCQLVDKKLGHQETYGAKMIMRFNKIHKFSDGTPKQIDEALDYRVKEYQINKYNPGMNTRFWTQKDVDRSQQFMFAIKKRLKTRRIFWNLESFVGGRIREGDYRLLKRTE
ncbi:hypothetical protein Tco_0185202 [Tanacetum coccineum]